MKKVIDNVELKKAEQDFQLQTTNEKKKKKEKHLLFLH